MSRFLTVNLFPGILFEHEFPIDPWGDKVLRCQWSFDLAPGMHYSVDGVQVVGPRQSGLGARLLPHTFSSSYPANVGKLNELYKKVSNIEKVLRAHGLAGD